MTTTKQSEMEKLAGQVQLLLWKRYAESTKNKLDILKLIIPPLIFFALIPLGYATLPAFSGGAIEPFFVPLAYFVYVQRIVIQIMYEKSSRLYVYMKMMGMKESAYWISYYISESLTGIVLSFFCAVISATYFNGADFGTVLGLLFVYCLSVVPFAFTICSLFSTPETAGQVSLLIQFAMFIAYIIFFVTNERGPTSFRATQLACSFFPPLALQMGAGSFLNSYDGMPLSSLCGMMVADIFIYSFISWLLNKSYSFSSLFPSSPTVSTPRVHSEQKVGDEDDEALLGPATVIVRDLCKSFWIGASGGKADDGEGVKGGEGRGGQKRVVNNLSFKMYENQIFALLGHNGAGKTTTISILTGLLSPDGGQASIYNFNILSDQSPLRCIMGVCPQHDILFDQLTLYEHIIFFSQLKGFSVQEAKDEAERLISFFHLSDRLDNFGDQLSGGQKRKLSVALAVCGGSKFIILDEPTAGMDPLARRELWGLLASLRGGRTMLLTTHYMDEADILGDRVGIMSQGSMICAGSPYSLKRRYGGGYRLILNKDEDASKRDKSEDNEEVTKLIHSHIPAAELIEKKKGLTYQLPFDGVDQFPSLFTALDQSLSTLDVKSYGLSIASLEDVFINTGNVLEKEKYVIENYQGERIEEGKEGKGIALHISEAYAPSFPMQVMGVAFRKLHCAMYDYNTLVLLLLPLFGIIGGGLFYKFKPLSDFTVVNALISNAIYTISYLAIPGILAGFVITERGEKLVSLLRLMGCTPLAYWFGTFVADFIILLVPAILLFISWRVLDLPNYFNLNGINVLLVLVYNANLIAFAYLCTFLFNSYKACISFMPIFLIMLFIVPNFTYSIYNQIYSVFQPDASGAPSRILASVITWLIVICSPQGGFYTGLLDSGEDVSRLDTASFPPFYAAILIMLLQCTCYTAAYLYLDSKSMPKLTANFTNSQLIVDDVEGGCTLDEDVLKERRAVLGGEKDNDVLILKNLRKVYQNTIEGGTGEGGQGTRINRVIAVEDFCLSIPRGQIFGLLGANGAGKTSLLNMITRQSTPDCGDALICSRSVLSDAVEAFKGLSMVTQSNSLWNGMTVYTHVFLFALIRGVPLKYLMRSDGMNIVDNLLLLLQLYEHRSKFAGRLSGGQKRKLCTAIALIGEPAMILLDEPSAGLDPSSRRQLWQVVLSYVNRNQFVQDNVNVNKASSVLLTTHSMEEGEALCARIAVMVAGQLRALGSPQHLKSKFGDGYELIVKLQSVQLAQGDDSNGVKDAVNKQCKELGDFLSKHFSSAQFMNINASLVTYRLQGVVAIGKVFELMQQHRTQLGVEDYSITQPTLEQVFIHIMNQHTSQNTPEAIISSEHEHRDPSVVSKVTRKKVDRKSLLQRTRSKLGCSDPCLRITSIIFAILGVALIVIGSFVGISASSVGGSVIITAGIMGLIVVFVQLCLLCCISCRLPLVED